MSRNFISYVRLATLDVRLLAKCWVVLLSASPAMAAVPCGPVPTAFPLTTTAVSQNFAKLYECINTGEVAFPSPTIFVNAIVSGTLMVGTLVFPDGVSFQESDGVVYVNATGATAPAFDQTNLGLTIDTKLGLVRRRILVGPENSGGIGYRMLRVVN